MSSKSGSTTTRVSIPSNLKKTIQNIKEIAGNHSEDEIYALLRECNLDPDETAQKLLFQDTFHEVKRKRDRKRENLTKESAEPKWKPAMQGRGNKGSRGNFTLHHVSPDANGGRNTARENGVSKVAYKSISPSPVANGEAKNTSSSSIARANGHVKLVGSLHTPNGDTDKGKSMSSSPSSGAYFSTSDPVLLPSHDSRLLGAVGTIRKEVGGQHAPVEHVPTNSKESKTTSVSDSRRSTAPVKISSKSQGLGMDQLPESSQSASSAQGVSSLSRPSSSYNDHSQVMGPQKAGSVKEWKPKPTNNDISTVSAEVDNKLQPPAVDAETKEGTSELQQKFEKTHISDTRHVIIPNHLYVPEPEKLGFCFGSFEAGVGLGLNTNNAAADNEKTPSVSETSEVIEETPNEQFSSDQSPSTATEHAEFSDPSPPSSHGQENSSEEASLSVPEYNGESKQEILQEGRHHYTVVHTSPNYSFGFVPPSFGGSQLTPLENSESQSRDVSSFPNFIVQQPIDPTSYYAQFYRSGADSDGRVSPFHLPGVSTSYNGNVGVVPPQTSQSSQEGGSPLVLSTAAPMPLAAQAAGVVQSSAAAAQQALPVFRQATGMHHIPHYPPNYIPYGHYFSPYYVPPTAIQQYLSNGAFPLQPTQASSVYPPPPATSSRYSYRPGTNVGNSAHAGLPGSYGPYGSSTANYNPSSTTTAGINPDSNEDLSASQYKENNVNMSRHQQSEGTGVWLAPGRDLSALQASSFYNLPQGQVAFTPTQPGHGNLPGLYHHPAQAVTAQSVHPHMHQSQTMAGPIDMVGPTATVYQQPQHSQINWPSSY